MLDILWCKECLTVSQQPTIETDVVLPQPLAVQCVGTNTCVGISRQKAWPHVVSLRYGRLKFFSTIQQFQPPPPRSEVHGRLQGLLETGQFGYAKPVSCVSGNKGNIFLLDKDIMGSTIFVNLANGTQAGQAYQYTIMAMGSGGRSKQPESLVMGIGDSAQPGFLKTKDVDMGFLHLAQEAVLPGWSNHNTGGDKLTTGHILDPTQQIMKWKSIGGLMGKCQQARSLVHLSGL